MGILWSMLIGGVAGWLAGQLMKSTGNCVLVNIILGLIGGLVGGSPSASSVLVHMVWSVSW
jgi:uncharacterized membrane protein YeaQ/YmgE (transglycosylase-associated protein family)